MGVLLWSLLVACLGSLLIALLLWNRLDPHSTTHPPFSAAPPVVPRDGVSAAAAPCDTGGVAVSHPLEAAPTVTTPWTAACYEQQVAVLTATDLWVWTLDEGKLLHQVELVPAPARPQLVGIAPSTWLYAATTGWVRVTADAAHIETLPDLPVVSWVHGALGLWPEGSLRAGEWALGSQWQTTEQWTLPHTPTAIEVRGFTVVYAVDQNLYQWDLRTRQLERSWEVGGGVITALRADPAGLHWLALTPQGPRWFWRPQASEPLVEITQWTEWPWVTEVVWAPGEVWLWGAQGLFRVDLALWHQVAVLGYQKVTWATTKPLAWTEASRLGWEEGRAQLTTSAWRPDLLWLSPPLASGALTVAVAQSVTGWEMLQKC